MFSSSPRSPNFLSFLCRPFAFICLLTSLFSLIFSVSLLTIHNPHPHSFVHAPFIQPVAFFICRECFVFSLVCFKKWKNKKNLTDLLPINRSSTLCEFFARQRNFRGEFFACKNNLKLDLASGEKKKIAEKSLVQFCVVNQAKVRKFIEWGMQKST